MSNSTKFFDYINQINEEYVGMEHMIAELEMLNVKFERLSDDEKIYREALNAVITGMYKLRTRGLVRF